MIRYTKTYLSEGVRIDMNQPEGLKVPVSRWWEREGI